MINVVRLFFFRVWNLKKHQKNIHEIIILKFKYYQLSQTYNNIFIIAFLRVITTFSQIHDNKLTIAFFSRTITIFSQTHDNSFIVAFLQVITTLFQIYNNIFTITYSQIYKNIFIIMFFQIYYDTFIIEHFQVYRDILIITFFRVYHDIYIIIYSQNNQILFNLSIAQNQHYIFSIKSHDWNHCTIISTFLNELIIFSNLNSIDLNFDIINFDSIFHSKTQEKSNEFNWLFAFTNTSLWFSSTFLLFSKTKSKLDILNHQIENVIDTIFQLNNLNLTNITIIDLWFFAQNQTIFRSSENAHENTFFANVNLSSFLNISCVIFDLFNNSYNMSLIITISIQFTSRVNKRFFTQNDDNEITFFTNFENSNNRRKQMRFLIDIDRIIDARIYKTTFIYDIIKFKKHFDQQRVIVWLSVNNQCKYLDYINDFKFSWK